MSKTPSDLQWVKRFNRAIGVSCNYPNSRKLQSQRGYLAVCSPAPHEITNDAGTMWSGDTKQKHSHGGRPKVVYMWKWNSAFDARWEGGGSKLG